MVSVLVRTALELLLSVVWGNTDGEHPPCFEASSLLRSERHVNVPILLEMEEC